MTYTRESALFPRSGTVLVALGTTVMLIPGLVFAGETTARGLDAAAEDAVAAAFAGQPGLLRLFAAPTAPAVVLGMLLLIAGTCLRQRRPYGLALALCAPPIAIGANAWLLKPAFGRMLDDHLAYPSGHTVSLIAVATVLALLARPGAATWLTLASTTLALAAACVGMIGLRYHYLTDVLGATGFAVAVVLSLASALDALARRSS